MIMNLQTQDYFYVIENVAFPRCCWIIVVIADWNDLSHFSSFSLADATQIPFHFDEIFLSKI